MGYTHYWTQKRDMTREEWAELVEGAMSIAAGAILSGVAICREYTEPMQLADMDGNRICFNGSGDDGHETFLLTRKRDKENWNFCKTARKPYDDVVTAILAYLDSIHGDKWVITSDGRTADWARGVEIARKAWPAKANQTQAPRDVIETDRYARYYDRDKHYQVACSHDGRLWVERHSDKFRAPLPFADERGYNELVASWGRAYRKYGSFNGDAETCAKKRLARVWKLFGANAEAPEFFAPIRA